MRSLFPLLMFLALSSSSQGSVKLEWKFTPGESFLTERVYDQKQEITVKGRTFSQEVAGTWRARFTVLSRYWGKWLLQVTLEEVSYKTGGLGGPAAFDEKLAARLKGASLTLLLTGQGEVNRLRGYDDFIRQLAEGKPENEKVLKALFSEEGLEETFAEMFAFLPRKAADPGDKWERDTVEPVPPFGFFRSRFEYQYEGLKEGAHAISYTVKTEFNKPKDPPALFRLIKGELTGEEGKGFALFDADAGRLVRGERTMTVRGQLTIEAAGVQSEMRFVSQNRLKVRVVREK